MLHGEIQNLLNAPKLDIDIAREASEFVSRLRDNFPTISAFLHGVIGLIAVASFLILLCMLLPFCIRLICKQMYKLAMDIRLLQLRREKDSIPLEL